MVNKKAGTPIPENENEVDDNEDVKELGFDWENEEDSTLDAREAPLDVRRPPQSSICCHENHEASQIPPRYSEIFPLTVNEFFTNFLSDKSESFWSEFHSRDGYNHFTLSPWKLSAEECCLERNAEFRAPIRVSLAPIYTRVVQQHRCRFISENELVFETSSHSLDVPFSNQFLVQSRWTISKFDENNCELNICIFVNFIKKNFLKVVIERNAIEGSREWFENWIKSALAVINNQKRNNATPKSRRIDDQQLLRSSMTHSSRATKEPSINESDTKPDTFFTQLLHFFYLVLSEKSLRNVLLCLFIFNVILFFTFYFLSSSFYSYDDQINELNDKYSVLKNDFDTIIGGLDKNIDFRAFCEYWKGNTKLDINFNIEAALDTIGDTLEKLKTTS